MAKCSTRIAGLCGLVLLILGGSPAIGQVDDEVIAGVQFNFTPPGARSLGLGGAFLAVANDATTAFTNPAGLTNLTQQEVSIEGRSFSTSTLFTNGGRATCSEAGGCRAQNGSGAGFDNRNGLDFGQSDGDTTGLSFISYVLPVGDFRLALFRHELVNFESTFRTDGAFVETTDGGGVCQPRFVGGVLDVNTALGCLRLFPVDTGLNLDVENIGASFAYKFGENFSVGVGLNFYNFDIAALTNRFDVLLSLDETTVTAPGGFFGSPNFAPTNVFATQAQDGDDNAFGLNVGFLWKASRFFSIGGAYRDGPSFDYTYTLSCGPSDPAFCRTIAGLETGTNVNAAEFNIPTVWGLGLAFKPTDNLTIALDYDSVEYSTLTDNFVVAANLANDPTQFTVDDADEFHIGLEYVFANLRNPIIIRVGGWEDPAHQISYGGNNPATSVILWQGSDDETHYSAGVGFIVGERFSLDLAYDTSDRVDIGALSAVVRF